jgi:hypothetical protein
MEVIKKIKNEYEDSSDYKKFGDLVCLTLFDNKKEIIETINKFLNENIRL